MPLRVRVCLFALGSPRVTVDEYASYICATSILRFGILHETYSPLVCHHPSCKFLINAYVRDRQSRPSCSLCSNRCRVGVFKNIYVSSCDRSPPVCISNQASSRLRELARSALSFVSLFASAINRRRVSVSIYTTHFYPRSIATKSTTQPFFPLSTCSFYRSIQLFFLPSKSASIDSRVSFAFSRNQPLN